MKTVTIPTSQSPFVVMVNGAKYVYPAGSVQDVPDEVAVVIEAHNKQTAKPNEPVEAPFDCDCGGGGGAQSDWNQTDSSAADFIKNKPFGESEGYIFPEQEVPYDPDQQACVAVIDGGINGGDTITVVYDGVSYICNAIFAADIGQVFFGNFSLMGESDDTGEPFVGTCVGNMAFFLPIDTNSHVIGIISKITKKIPAEYMEVRTFYVSVRSPSDPYIYTDAMCTTKATKEEVMVTAKVQNFRLVMAMEGIGLFSMPVLNVPVHTQSDFRIYAFDTIDEEIKIYRTAEYTPET